MNTRPSLIFAALLFAATSVKSQLTITAGSTFFIEPTAIVTVEGDITGLASITGGGKVVLSGNAAVQNVNMNGFTIPNLEIDNAFNANLTGNTRIGTSLLFTIGKINAGDFNLILSDVATSTGMGASKFVETNGTGQVIKELTANVTSSEIPVGAGTVYRPAFLTTAGTYSSANVGVKVLGVVNPNRPPSLTEYIASYWPVTKTGVTGTVTLAGQYDNTDISGSEANLRGYYYNSATTDWSSAGQTATPASNQVSAPIAAATGELYAMDKFNLVKTKAFLQAAYVNGTGLMSETLRTLGYIPNADPYRVAPYTTSFTHHASNTLSENAAASVFTTQAIAADNIVDWVFLELRNNTSPGSVILQTRSALIQRDGDIVDVDGVSPVTFNNLATGNYTIAVRHRNHLGLSTDPTAFNNLFGETKSTASLVDLSIASDANLFGTSAAYTIAGDGKNLLWGGNANGNTNTKYQGSQNDPLTILSDLGGNQLSIVNGYLRSDINMNGNAKYQGSQNDMLFLLTVVGGNQLTIRNQELPF